MTEVPTNVVEITWSDGQSVEAKLWDKDGVEHDFTSVFKSITGATGVGARWSKMSLGNGDISTTLEYRPTSKELKFGVSEKVINQILEVQ